MRYAVEPGAGAGAIRLGMSRDDVHARLGEPDDEGGWPDAGEIEDTWEADGIAVVFDAAGSCAEIALFPPATASIRGTRLLGPADGDPAAALAAVAPDVADVDGVLVSRELGLLLMVDDDGDPELVLLRPERLDTLASADGGTDDADEEDEES